MNFLVSCLSLPSPWASGVSCPSPLLSVLNTLGLKAALGGLQMTALPLRDQRQPRVVRDPLGTPTLQLLRTSLVPSGSQHPLLPASQKVASFEVFEDGRCVRNHCLPNI